MKKLILFACVLFLTGCTSKNEINKLKNSINTNSEITASNQKQISKIINDLDSIVQTLNESANNQNKFETFCYEKNEKHSVGSRVENKICIDTVHLGGGKKTNAHWVNFK